MYFTKKETTKTQETIQLALQRAKELNINQIVVASCSGETAKLLINKGFELVCVTHHVGFAGPGVDEMPKDARLFLESHNVKLLTTTHLLAGVDRALKNKFGGIYPAEIMAFTLRIMGQGLKVCVEISSMALDAGLIPTDREIIAIGGSSEGADTAIVITPAHSNNFFDTKIHEIICKPRNW